jgi:hypothetical protein
MEQAKKRHTRNTNRGFRSERDRFFYLMGLINAENATCLNDVLNRMNRNEFLKEKILALALGNENQGHKLLAQSSPSSGKIPSSRK